MGLKLATYVVPRAAASAGRKARKKRAREERACGAADDAGAEGQAAPEAAPPYQRYASSEQVRVRARVRVRLGCVGQG